jgi:hypothetical protein
MALAGQGRADLGQAKVICQPCEPRQQERRPLHRLARRGVFGQPVRADTKFPRSCAISCRWSAPAEPLHAETRMAKGVIAL